MRNGKHVLCAAGGHTADYERGPRSRAPPVVIIRRVFNDRVRTLDSRKYYTMYVHADTLCSLCASFAALLRLYIMYPSKRDSNCFMRFFHIY